MHFDFDIKMIIALKMQIKKNFISNISSYISESKKQLIKPRFFLYVKTIIKFVWKIY